MNYFLSFFQSENFCYVIDAPYFWQAMASTTICAMFVGAVLHNGDFNSMRKASISLLTYIVMLLVTTVARVIPIYEKASQTLTTEQLAQTYANPVTIIFLSVFWFVGLIWGVYLVNYTKNKRR